MVTLSGRQNKRTPNARVGSAAPRTEPPTFDPALLDALALCFVEAAVDQLLAEQTSEGKSLPAQEKHSVSTNRGPDLLGLHARTTAEVC